MIGVFLEVYPNRLKELQVRMRFRLATPSDYDAWEAFVGRIPHAEFSHSIHLKRIYEKVFGLNTFYWMGEEGREIKAVCPLVVIHSLLHWNRRFFIALPMVTSAGVLAGSAAHTEAFHGHLERVAKDERSIVQIRNRETNALANAPGYDGYVSFQLSLEESPDAYWRRLSSRNRNKLRKARQSEIVVRFGGVELLDLFYKVYLRRNKEFATPAYPQSFFKELLLSFSHAEIALALQGETPVSGMFNIGFGDTVNYVYGGSDSRYFKLYPNNLLYYESIQRARELGYRTFDFGRSPLEGGTARFKKQWCATPIPLHYQYLGDSAEEFVNLSIQSVQASLGFRLFSFAWRHCLPMWVVRLLGSQMIKRMPLA